MLSLKYIYTLLFSLGIFFIPFNEFDGLSFLGEYKDEAATYFFLFGFLFVVLETIVQKKFYFPYKHPLIIVLVVFTIWTFITFLVNYDTIKFNFYKQTSGISRYIRQTISFVIAAYCFSILFWNVINKLSITQAVLKIRKILLYSFSFVAFYAFIEIGIVYFGAGFLKPILNVFEYFPFINNHLHNGERIGISSVTFEIPALGNYLIFVAPWMLSYILTERGFLKYIPSLLVIILMLFSNARAAFVVILIQLFSFVLLLWYDKRFRSTVTITAKLLVIGLVALITFKPDMIFNTFSTKIDSISFSKNLTQSISNKSRFGMQVASLQVFKENPVYGVGFGQGAYHMVNHYPYWSTAHNWEFKYKYKNQSDKSFPPQFNIYTRLLAEVGFIGFLLFLILTSAPIFYALQFWKKADYRDKYIGVILVLSFLGFAINWLQLDFFKQYGFWLSLALLLKITSFFQHKEQNND